MDDLQTLLNLDGERFRVENGYWVKFEVKKIEVSDESPHGLRYSITLHDSGNRRVLGYDNIHAFKPLKGNRFGARKTAWDHVHKRDMTWPYEFETAAGLLEDFWRDAEKLMGEK